MIRPPRAEGPYRDRDLDCQEALETLFLDLVREADTAFLDLSRSESASSKPAWPPDGISRISILPSPSSCAVTR